MSSKNRPIIDQRVPVDSDAVLISRTDKHGNIIYANQGFISISGYSESELLGQPHNILRHPDMPKAVYELFWNCLTQGREFNGYIKNRTKSGAYYWVFANAANQDMGDESIYMSVRRRPKERSLEAIIPHYQEMLRLEQQGSAESGLQQSSAYLAQLHQHCANGYDEFIFSL